MTETRTLTRRFNTYPRTEVRWLWKPYIPLGKVSVIQGDPGDGKTTLTLALSALLSTGQPLPETDGEPVFGEILYQSAEDAVGDTLEPRLAAMGADCSVISNISVPFNDIEKDCELLENAIREVGAVLFVLDPLQAFIGKGNDMTRAADMRRLMSGLAVAAAKTSCAVVAIGHMNKAERSKTLYRGLGSIDIAASARNVLHVGRSAEDREIWSCRTSRAVWQKRGSRWRSQSATILWLVLSGILTVKSEPPTFRTMILNLKLPRILF